MHKKYKIKMNKKTFFLFLLLTYLNGYSFDFYTTKKIPYFSVQEQLVFNRFEISFKSLKGITETKIHNSQVLKIIKKHGNNWKKELENKLDTINSIEAKKFIVNLFEKEHDFSILGQRVEFYDNGVIYYRTYFSYKYVKKNGIRVRRGRPIRHNEKYNKKGKCVNKEKYEVYPFV